MSTELLIAILATIAGVNGWALGLLISLHNKMGKSETWQEQHEKQDDDRFHSMNERFDRLHTYMHEER